jgi:hypothetical protein
VHKGGKGTARFWGRIYICFDVAAGGVGNSTPTPTPQHQETQTNLPTSSLDVQLLQTDNFSPALFSPDRIAAGVCLTLKLSNRSTRPVRPVFPTSLRTSLKQPVHTQRSQSHLLCQFCAVSRARVPPSVISSSPGLPQAGFDPPLADAWCPQRMSGKKYE